MGVNLKGVVKSLIEKLDYSYSFDFVDASTPDDPGIALMDLTPNIAEKYMGIPGGNDLKQFYGTYIYSADLRCLQSRLC